MTYTIYADTDLLYDPRLPEYAVIDSVLDLKVNEPGLLTFTIPESNPVAGAITKLASRIKVYRDGQLIFLGRVIKDERQLGHRRKYTAEGCLAYLIDSVCDPYSFTGTPAQFFTFLINWHNAAVSAAQHGKIVARPLDSLYIDVAVQRRKINAFFAFQAHTNSPFPLLLL